MKLKLVLAGVVLVLAAALVVFHPLFYRYQSDVCKQRGAAFTARVEKLKRDAQKSLRLGTSKDEVIQFFTEHGIPVTVIDGEATGSIIVIGCAPAGCGSDDAILGLRVKIDMSGTVIGEPSVGAFYSDCV